MSSDHGFDRAIIAAAFGVLGVILAAMGSVMTGLAYAYESRPGFVSLAENSDLQTEIAGPVLLAVGGSGLIVCLAMIAAGVCATPEWARKRSQDEPAAPRTVDIEGVTYHTGNGPRY